MLKQEKATYNILAACFHVYKTMGCGFLEAVYQECLEIEFKTRKIIYKAQPRNGVIKIQTAHGIHGRTRKFICFFPCSSVYSVGKKNYDRLTRVFIDSLRKSGIDVSEAYLFGSVPKGLADKDSDIDLAVVSSDFQGIRYHNMKKISKYRRKMDSRLEIHPFTAYSAYFEGENEDLRVKNRLWVSIFDDI